METEDCGTNEPAGSIGMHRLTLCTAGTPIARRVCSVQLTVFAFRDANLPVGISTGRSMLRAAFEKYVMRHCPLGENTEEKTLK